jgi:Flp pilus assembly pilin Flp
VGDETAAGLVEYALIVGLIAMLAVGALATFRGALSSSVENSATQLQQVLGS